MLDQQPPCARAQAPPHLHGSTLHMLSPTAFSRSALEHGQANTLDCAHAAQPPAATGAAPASVTRPPVAPKQGQEAAPPMEAATYPTKQSTEADIRQLPPPVQPLKRALTPLPNTPPLAPCPPYTPTPAAMSSSPSTPVLASHLKVPEPGACEHPHLSQPQQARQIRPQPAWAGATLQAGPLEPDVPTTSLQATQHRSGAAAPPAHDAHAAGIEASAAGAEACAAGAATGWGLSSRHTHIPHPAAAPSPGEHTHGPPNATPIPSKQSHTPSRPSQRSIPCSPRTKQLPPPPPSPFQALANAPSAPLQGSPFGHPAMQLQPTEADAPPACEVPRQAAPASPRSPSPISPAAGQAAGQPLVATGAAAAAAAGEAGVARVAHPPEAHMRPHMPTPPGVLGRATGGWQQRTRRPSCLQQLHPLRGSGPVQRPVLPPLSSAPRGLTPGGQGGGPLFSHRGPNVGKGGFAAAGRAAAAALTDAAEARRDGSAGSSSNGAVAALEGVEEGLSQLLSVGNSLGDPWLWPSGSLGLPASLPQAEALTQAPSCKSEPVVSCPSAAGPVEASLTPAGSQGLTTLDWLLHPQQQEMMQQLQQQGQGPEAADGAAGTAGGGGPGDAPLSSCSPTGPTLSLPPPGDAPAYPLPAAPGLGGALGRSESLAAINAAYESMLGLRAASSLGLAWPDQADGGLDTALAAAPAPVHTRAVALPAAGCPGMEGLGGVRAVSCTQGGSLGGIDDPLGLGLDEAPSCLRALDGLDACCLPPPADDAAAAAAAAAAALHPHGALTAASPQQRCTLTPADCAAAAPHPHGSRLHATSGAAAAAGGLDACRPLLLPMLETPTCPAMDQGLDDIGISMSMDLADVELAGVDCMSAPPGPTGAVLGNETTGPGGCRGSGELAWGPGAGRQGLQMPSFSTIHVKEQQQQQQQQQQQLPLPQMLGPGAGMFCTPPSGPGPSSGYPPPSLLAPPPPPFKKQGRPAQRGTGVSICGRARAGGLRVPALSQSSSPTPALNDSESEAQLHSWSSASVSPSPELSRKSYTPGAGGQRGRSGSSRRPRGGSGSRARGKGLPGLPVQDSCAGRGLAWGSKPCADADVVAGAVEAMEGEGEDGEASLSGTRTCAARAAAKAMLPRLNGTLPGILPSSVSMDAMGLAAHMLGDPNAHGLHEKARGQIMGPAAAAAAEAFGMGDFDDLDNADDDDLNFEQQVENLQGILDAACIPSLPVPLRTLMEACWANSKSSKVPAQPTARDLTNHMPPEQRSAAMARIRREKNRQAARKCRTKKIRCTNETEQRLNDLHSANRALRQELSGCRALFAREWQRRELLKLIIRQHWTQDGKQTSVLRQALPPDVQTAAGVISAVEAGTLEVQDVIARLQVLQPKTEPPAPSAAHPTLPTLFPSHSLARDLLPDMPTFDAAPLGGLKHGPQLDPAPASQPGESSHAPLAGLLPHTLPPSTQADHALQPLDQAGPPKPPSAPAAPESTSIAGTWGACAPAIQDAWPATHPPSPLLHSHPTPPAPEPPTQNVQPAAPASAPSSAPDAAMSGLPATAAPPAPGRHQDLPAALFSDGPTKDPTHHRVPTPPAPRAHTPSARTPARMQPAGMPIGLGSSRRASKGPPTAAVSLAAPSLHAPASGRARPPLPAGPMLSMPPLSGFTTRMAGPTRAPHPMHKNPAAAAAAAAGPLPAPQETPQPAAAASNCGKEGNRGSNPAPQATAAGWQQQAVRTGGGGGEGQGRLQTEDAWAWPLAQLQMPESGTPASQALIELLALTAKLPGMEAAMLGTLPQGAHSQRQAHQSAEPAGHTGVHGITILSASLEQQQQPEQQHGQQQQQQERWLQEGLAAAAVRERPVVEAAELPCTKRVKVEAD